MKYKSFIDLIFMKFGFYAKIVKDLNKLFWLSESNCWHLSSLHFCFLIHHPYTKQLEIMERFLNLSELSFYHFDKIYYKDGKLWRTLGIESIPYSAFITFIRLGRSVNNIF